MHEINRNVVFVQGKRRGAIYNFNTGKVYSLNKEACGIILKLISLESKFLEFEKNYINLLISEKLYEKNFLIREYLPIISNKIEFKTVWLEITQACNLKCLHCYEGNEHFSSRSTLSLEKWKNIIDELSELNVSNIVIIGGEPSCHPQVEEILKYATQYSFQLTFFTNGTLLSDNLKEILIKNNVSVKISIYGHNSIIHDKITRNNGSFDEMTKNIKFLMENGVKVYPAVVIMNENQEYIREIQEYIKKIGMKYNGYDVIRNVFGGTQSEHTPTNGNVLNNAILTKPSFITSKEIFDSNFHKNSCWYGKIAITETGEVLPCVFERNLSYGNITNISIKSLESFSLLKENWFRNFNKIKICKDCEYRFACKDCRPLGISVCGDIDEKNPRCTYNPYTGIWNNGVEEDV